MAVLMKFRVDGFAALKAKEIKPIMFAALEDVGEYWRDNYADEHFKNSAFTRYGSAYKPRMGMRGSARRFFKGSYTFRKLKTFGHTKPLVWSGNTRRELLSTRKIKGAGTATNARVEISLPIGLNRRHPNSKVRMLDEVMAVTSAERKKLTEYLVARISYHLDKAGRQKSSSANVQSF